VLGHASEIRNKTAKTASVSETVRLECGSAIWLYKAEPSMGESREFVAVDLTRQTLELLPESTRSSTGIVTVLTIQNVVQSDAGVYSCLDADHIQQYLLHVRDLSGKLEKCVGPVPTYCAAVRLKLRNPNLNPDL